jgi:hypothetical protein
MATKKNNNFLTNQIKKDLKDIITAAVSENKKLTSDDGDVLTIRKTDNGYILDYNDGTPTELPTVEVLETNEMDGSDDTDMYKDGLLSLLYSVALWSGYEYDPDSESNLNIDWSLRGDNQTEEQDDDDSEEDFNPPSKEEIIAAAMGKQLPKKKNKDEIDEVELDDGVRYDDELDNNEWVAGDDYSGTDDDVEYSDNDDEDGYNEEFEDE